MAAGPWLQWHFEAFTTPPGAEELARSPACAQAFRLGPHLAVQFHPESTAEIVSEWARHDAPRLDGALDEHLRRLAETGRRSGSDAERAAMRLFDGFWAARATGARRPDDSAREEDMLSIPGRAAALLQPFVAADAGPDSRKGAECWRTRQ